MARIRTIKPEFPQSESMGRVSREARLCFLLLFTLVDDAGRTRASSRMLASLLFPYDDDAPKLIDVWLTELESEQSLVRYEVDGNTYLQISKWLTHQKIDKPSPSRLPEFVESSRIVSKPREESSEDLVPSIKDLDLVSSPPLVAERAPTLREPKKITDSRHTPFRTALEKYYAFKAKMAMTWSASEAKQLSEFLVANPLLTLEEFQTILNNRAKSDVTHSERPRVWLANATDYLNEPLDRFKKPLGGNTHVKPERSEQILTGAQRLDEKLRSQAVGQPTLSGIGVDEAQPALGRLCS